MPGQADPNQGIKDAIRDAAKKHGIPSALALAVAERESSFDPDAAGKEITVGGKKVRAQGLFQLLPDTAARLKVDAADPNQNIDGGVRYLKELLDQHQGDEAKALSTYGGVVRDTEYVPAVQAGIARYMQLEGAANTVAASQTARAAAGAPAAGAPAGAPPAGAPGAAPPAVKPTTPPGAPPHEYTWWDTEKMYLKDFASNFDPRNPEFRRNVIGMGAEALATYKMPTAKVGAPLVTRALLRAGQTAVPALAAGAATAADTWAENKLGIGDKADPLVEGGIQAGFSAFGTTVFWPIVSRLGRGMFGGTVARNAKAALTEKVEATQAKGEVKVEGVRQQARQWAKQAEESAFKALEAVKAQGRALVAPVRQMAADNVADIELRNAGRLADLQTALNSIVRTPGQEQTVTQMQEVLKGPTRAALNMAGERVAAAAAHGPVVPFLPIQATINRLRTSSSKQIVEEAISAATPAKPLTVGEIANLAAEKQRAAREMLADPQYAKMSPLQIQEYLADQFARGEKGEAVDTIPVLLQRLGSAELTELPYATMHSLKRVLDNAVNWDKPAKEINEQLTKGLRKQVREAMRGYHPYDLATAAYDNLHDLYFRGAGAAALNAFKNNPAQAAKLLHPDNAPFARQMKSLLIDQAAAGGDAVAGQKAWDTVRSYFMARHVYKDGIAGLEKNFAKASRDSGFYQTMFGDESGAIIATNVKDAITGYNLMVAHGAAELAAAKATGAAGIEAAETVAASQTARQSLTNKQTVKQASQLGADKLRAARGEARADTKAARKELAKFQKTTLGKTVDPFSSLIGDVSHVMRVGAATRGTVQALVRIFTGPSRAEMLEYVVHTKGLANLLTKWSQTKYLGPEGSLLLRALVEYDSQNQKPAKEPAQAPAAAAPPAAAAAR